MADSYHHGARVTELSTGARALVTVATAVIGMVATAPDADAAAFPPNRPVLVTDMAGAISKAGAGGTLGATLEAIADQVSAPVVVVVVEPGTGDDDAAKAASLEANVIGAAVGGAYTGLQALLAAESQLGVRPRILGAPGLDTEAVTQALGAIAPKLRGFAYAAGIGAAVADVLTYRAGFGQRELMLIWPDFTSFDPTANAASSAYAVARAMGLRAQIDQTIGWHKTLSNVPVAGVTGISKDVHFGLQAVGTDADLLNAAGVTTLVRMNGFRFWGSRTCSEDPAFAFESATRTAQVIADTVAEGLAWAVDKPLHPTIGRDIVETINAKFRAFVAQGYLLGGNAWLTASKNTSAGITSGKLVVDYDYTPIPPLEDLELNQTITDSYAADFTAQAGATIAG